MSAVDGAPACFYERTCRPIAISQQVPLDWAEPLYGHVMPVIVAVTVATNSFIVVVLSHKYLRTPTNFVLLAMAVSELLTGLSCIPWFIYYYTLQGYKHDVVHGLPSFWCEAVPYVASFLPSVFHAVAIWLTVYLAIQRYIYICVPSLVRRFCTIEKSKQAIVFICAASLLIYSPELLATHYESYTVFDNTRNRSVNHCYRFHSRLMRTIGPNNYYKVLFTVHTMLIHFVPCLLCVIFTWKLIVAIRKADRKHASLLSKSVRVEQQKERVELRRTSVIELHRKMSRLYRQRDSVSEPKRVQGLKQNTRMLLVVIVLFLLTEIPAAVIFSVHVISVTLRINWGHYHLLNILLIVRNVMIVISYPFRFAIYCGMSKQFREVVQQMFLRKIPLHNRVNRESSASFALHLES